MLSKVAEATAKECKIDKDVMERLLSVPYESPEETKKKTGLSEV